MVTLNVKKDSAKICLLGTLDEANSFLGLAASFCEEKLMLGKLQRMQKDLMTISAILAGAKRGFPKTEVLWLGKEIKILKKQLPLLKNFLLPGGATLAALLQVARSMVRRAERETVGFAKTEKVKPAILSYLNSLSSFLFLLAREANVNWGVAEEKW